jgi:hypothetical protein
MNLLVLFIILVIKFKWNDIMVDFVVTGFNEASGFEMNFSKDGKIDAMHIGPDDKYSSMEFSIEHDIQEKVIPGKGKKNITMRIVDIHSLKTGPLLKFSITQSTVTKKFWDSILRMVRLGGPYHVTWIFPDIVDMYITKGSFKQESGFAEDPDVIYLDNGSTVQAMVGVWTIEFMEYNKGFSGAPSINPAQVDYTIENYPTVNVPTKSDPKGWHFVRKNDGRVISWEQYFNLASSDRSDPATGENMYDMVPGAI